MRVAAVMEGKKVAVVVMGMKVAVDLMDNWGNLAKVWRVC